MKILSLIGSLIDRLFVVVGAFLGSQIPEFIQQYTQRLAGHVDELQLLLNQMRQVASYSNKTLDQYIQKFISSSDPDFVRQGEFMQGMFSRWEELKQALNHLTESAIWNRAYTLLKELNYDIAQSALYSFQPGINLSIEGLCYTIFGIFLGWAFIQTLYKALSFVYHCTAFYSIRLIQNFKI